MDFYLFFLSSDFFLHFLIRVNYIDIRSKKIPEREFLDFAMAALMTARSIYLPALLPNGKWAQRVLLVRTFSNTCDTDSVGNKAVFLFFRRLSIFRTKGHQILHSSMYTVLRKCNVLLAEILNAHIIIIKC